MVLPNVNRRKRQQGMVSSALTRRPYMAVICFVIGSASILLMISGFGGILTGVDDFDEPPTSTKSVLTPERNSLRKINEAKLPVASDDVEDVDTEEDSATDDDDGTISDDGVATETIEVESDDEEDDEENDEENDEEAPYSEEEEEGSDSSKILERPPAEVEEGSDFSKTLEEPPAKVEDVTTETAKEDYDVCIVGAGLSAAVIAEKYANELKKSVFVMEKRNHIGGNCYDFIDPETNIRISKYGAHLFHTESKRVWDYVQKWTSWTKWEHEVVGKVEDKHVPIPVNIKTVNILFDLKINSTEEMDEWLEKEQVKYDEPPKNSAEMAKSRVGERLYELIFRPYTVKQWAKDPSELGPEVTARIPVRNDFDGRYFSDPYQALPSKGYTAIFEKMFDNPLITTKINTDYFEIRDKLRCGRTYFTGPIDAYFAHLGWDKLEYRSLDFERVVEKNEGFYQPNSVVNHPSADADFTRIVEYKHFLNQTSNYTVYFKERSKDDGEPYYPVPNDKNKALFAKYQEMSKKEENVSFVGRLANYKYFNMDETILNALELFDKDTKGKSKPSIKSK